MFQESSAKIIRTKGSKFGRVLIGLFFFVSGLIMLFMQTPAGVTGYFESLNIPLAAIAAWVVILIKIVGGGAIIIGRYVALSSAVLIVFTLLATLIAHLDIADPNLLKNLAVVGGLLYLMAFGPDGVDIKK